MARCEIHCPGGSAGVASAAVIALCGAVFAVAEFAVEYALILVPGLIAVGAAMFALQRFLLRRTVLVHATLRPPRAITRAAPARAVEARTAPLAIEAPAPVVYRITDLDEIAEGFADGLAASEE